MNPRGVALFVYGTLMEAEAQAGLLAGMRRVPARVQGRLFRMPAGYPALVLGPEAWVHGELVDLTEPRRLPILDTYEGVEEGLYERVQVPVWIGLRTLDAWTWVMTDPEGQGGIALPSGRWRGRRR